MEDIKNKILSEVKSEIFSLSSRITSETNKNNSTFSSREKSNLPSFEQSIPRDHLPQGPQNNCVVYICYNGEARQFALSGELIAKDKELDELPPLE